MRVVENIIGEGDHVCKKCGKRFYSLRAGDNLCTACEEHEIISGW
jgi:hypothetical protein